MTAATIVQLAISLGPVAAEFIRKMLLVWGADGSKELTPAQVVEFCEILEKKSYDDYINEATHIKM